MKRPMDEHLAAGNRRSVASFAPQHFSWRIQGRVGVVTLNGPSARTR